MEPEERREERRQQAAVGHPPLKAETGGVWLSKLSEPFIEVQRVFDGVWVLVSNKRTTEERM